ncbi:hypothetical protein K469DRAFT_571404, partial [Zopfia rhizophila CBS 207.26]
AYYNSTLRVRAIYSLLLYKKNKPIYNNSVYAITSIYYNNTFKIYISYIILLYSPKGRPQYYIIKVKSFNIINTKDIYIARL